MTGRALLAGGGTACGGAVARALRGAGFETRLLAWAEPLPEGLEADVAVLAPEVPAGAGAAETDPAEMLAALDDALIPAGLLARDLFARAPAGGDRRIVVLCDWAVTGPPAATIEAAVMGGMLGLARSWALEFAPLGVTVNAVVAGPDLAEAGATRPVSPGLVRSPTPEAVADAVLFFLSAGAGCVTGQVLTVCGGRTAARLPI